MSVNRTGDMPILGCPGVRPFPMGVLRPHARRAWLNHSQSLETLARRGGCCPQELLAILEERSAYDADLRRMTDEAALERLADHLSALMVETTDVANDNGTEGGAA